VIPHPGESLGCPVERERVDLVSESTQAVRDGVMPGLVAFVLVPPLVLAVVVPDVRSGLPIRWEVVPMPDIHMLVFDYVMVLHVVVRPGKPSPCGNWRCHHYGRWFVHGLAGGQGGYD
jgi:hypothetical protein